VWVLKRLALLHGSQFNGPGMRSRRIAADCQVRDVPVCVSWEAL
jgi:hypothetical protein